MGTATTSKTSKEIDLEMVSDTYVRFANDILKSLPEMRELEKKIKKFNNSYIHVVTKVRMDIGDMIDNIGSFTKKDFVDRMLYFFEYDVTDSWGTPWGLDIKIADNEDVYGQFTAIRSDIERLVKIVHRKLAQKYGVSSKSSPVSQRLVRDVLINRLNVNNYVNYATTSRQF